MSHPEQEFERELRRGLQRVDAPAGFADRVLERAAHEPRSSRLLGFPLRRAWIGSLAASLAFAALLVGGVEHRHRMDERTRAERDFARSLEITDRVMEQTRQRIQRAGVALED